MKRVRERGTQIKQENKKIVDASTQVENTVQSYSRHTKQRSHLIFTIFFK